MKKYSLFILIIIQVIVVSNVKWGGDRWKQIIAFDGKGYYAYLPGIFIYDDLQFKFHDKIEKEYSSLNTFFDFRQPAGNGTVNKYFAGAALAMLPFFLIGHLITIITGGLADGYSFYYQLMISLAAITYSALALLFLAKLLRLYQIKVKNIFLVIYSLALATPLFYYTVFEPSMSHVYSFFFTTAFLYFMKSISLKHETNLLLTAVFLAMIVLIRPVNGLILLAVPFIAGGKREFISLIKTVTKPSEMLVRVILTIVALLSIQPIIYYIQCGQLFPYTYGNEKLIFTNPEILNVLFSYKKGLFIYAPLLFIAVPGLIPLYKKNRWEFYSFIIFFLILTYVLSCWWIWWYGGGFGFRPMVEYYSLFAILFAILINSFKKRIHKFLIYTGILFCLILCQVQTYQYRYFFIHWEKMDKEHYWRIFMRIDQLAHKEEKGNPNQDLLEN